MGAFLTGTPLPAASLTLVPQTKLAFAVLERRAFSTHGRNLALKQAPTENVFPPQFSLVTQTSLSRRRRSADLAERRRTSGVRSELVFAPQTSATLCLKS